MGTYTTNYQLYTPTVGETGWGTLVNNNFTTIDTTMKGLDTRITAIESEVNGNLSCTSVTTSGMITSYGKITGNSGFEGKIIITTPSNDSNNIKLVTINVGSKSTSFNLTWNASLTLTPNDISVTKHNTSLFQYDVNTENLTYTDAAKLYNSLTTGATGNVKVIDETTGETLVNISEIYSSGSTKTYPFTRNMSHTYSVILAMETRTLSGSLSTIGYTTTEYI